SRAARRQGDADSARARRRDVPAPLPAAGAGQARCREGAPRMRHRRPGVLERRRSRGARPAPCRCRVPPRARAGAADSPGHHPRASGLHRRSGAAAGCAFLTMPVVSPITTASRPHLRGEARVDTIADARQFARLAHEWTDLLSASAADCVFLTWEWLHTWLTQLGQGRQLNVITVRAGGELIGVAPLMVCPPRVARLVPFRSLEFLGTGSVGSDYLDVVVRREREHEALDALAGSLANDG